MPSGISDNYFLRELSGEVISGFIADSNFGIKFGSGFEIGHDLGVIN
jgi:hypothetical protein